MYNLSCVLVVLVFSSDIRTELVTIETTRRGGSSGYRRCRCCTLLYLPCIFRLQTETIWVYTTLRILIFTEYAPISLYVISTRGGGGGGRRGSLYPLYVTTTDLLSVRGFTALSAIHKELLCHIRYPHGEMAFPLSVLNICIRSLHGFFIAICHPVSCQKLNYCCNCSLSLHTYMTPSRTKMYVGRRTNQIIGVPSIFAHPICENLNPLHISLGG